MSNEVLRSLLKEYEQKKLDAELEAEHKKEFIYNQIPELSQIESELNNFAIKKAKQILINGSDSADSELAEKIEFLRHKKEILLMQNNYTLNDLKPHYECSICNDTGYISDGDYKTSMCNCLRQKLIDISFNKSNISNLSKENFSTFNELRFSDEVDLAKYRLNISPRTNIKNIKQKCINFVENFDDINTKNLLFTGNTGLR